MNPRGEWIQRLFRRGILLGGGFRTDFSRLDILHDFRDLRRQYLHFECSNPAVPQRFHVHAVTAGGAGGRQGGADASRAE